MADYKWNAVMEALSTLYELYYSVGITNLPSLTRILEALDALMRAYNSWLD